MHPTGVRIETVALLRVVVAIAVPALALDGHETVRGFACAAGGQTSDEQPMAAAVHVCGERSAVTRRRRREVDGAAERAGAVGERIRSVGDHRVARAQRIDDAVVVVAVGGGDRQSVLHQLDAVLVVVRRIEVRAAAGEEEFVGAAAAFGPDTRDVAQQVGEVAHLAPEQVGAVDHRYGARRQGTLRFDLVADALRGDDDGFQRRCLCGGWRGLQHRWRDRQQGSAGRRRQR